MLGHSKFAIKQRAMAETAKKLTLPFLVTLLLVVFICLLASSVPVQSANTPTRRWKSLSTLRKINREGPYIGLITVYPPEENAFFSIGVFKPDQRHPYVDLSGRRFRVGNIYEKKVIYVRCGVGMVNAAAVTQQMFDMFNLMGVVHFGISGNANDSMSIGDVTVPSHFANTGLWDWLKPNGTLPTNDVAAFDFGNYNAPKGEGNSQLGILGYSPEQFFSVSGSPNTPQSLFWIRVTEKWVQIARTLEVMELEQCWNPSVCLEEKPKLVVGLKGSTSNFFLDNAAYRDFLFQTFQVSSVDMESSAVVMTSLSNGLPVIVIRGLSDLAGGQEGDNSIRKFGSLAALNVAKAVVQFINIIPGYHLK